jgi:putative tricarboxylic transport membrane protein
MRFSDSIFGAVLVLFAVAEIVYTRTFPTLHGQAYGPNLFPVLIGIGLIVCGILLIVRGVAARHAVPWVEFGDWVSDRHALINMLLVLLSLLLYISISDWLGFIPMSIIILTILLYRLGASMGVATGLAILATGVIQVLFARVLLVPLPAGLLRAVIW